MLHASWKFVICKRGVRTDEHIVFDLHAIPKLDAALDRYAVPDGDVVLDKRVIADVAIAADPCPGKDVRERPYSGPFAHVLGFHGGKVVYKKLHQPSPGVIAKC